jgi:hypothetical protein
VLIHGITIFCHIGNLLHRIPVLNNFAIVVNPEKIHCHVLFIARPSLVSVKCDQITFSHCACKFNIFGRASSCRCLEIVYKGLLSVLDKWIAPGLAQPSCVICCAYCAPYACWRASRSTIRLTRIAIKPGSLSRISNWSDSFRITQSGLSPSYNRRSTDVC